LTYDPESRGAAEYRALAEEIINGRAAPEEISASGALLEEIGNVKI
jgi:hypothetical protein